MFESIILRDNIHDIIKGFCSKNPFKDGCTVVLSTILPIKIFRNLDEHQIGNLSKIYTSTADSFVEHFAYEKIEIIINEPAELKGILILFINQAALIVKTVAVSYEKSKPESRLIDIDIYCRDQQITRAHLNLPPRQCIICEAPASRCIFEGNHGFDDLKNGFQLYLS